MPNPINDIRRISGLPSLEESQASASDLFAIEQHLTRYVRGMDNPMSALEQVNDALESALEGLHTMPTLSKIEVAAKQWKREVNLIYNDFRMSRETLYVVAKALGRPTKRRSPKHVPGKISKDAAGVIRDMERITSSTLKSLDKVADLSAGYLAELREFLKHGGANALTGDATDRDVAAGVIVDGFIDDVRQPNSTYFESLNAVAKRLRAAFTLAKMEFGIRESDGDAFHLDSEDDPELGG